MEKLFLSSFTLFAIYITLSLSACAAGEGTTPTGIDSYSYVSGSFSTLTTEQISGSGTIRFSSPLPGLTSTSHILVKGSLDLTTGSSLAIFFYSNSTSVDNNSGVEVRFTRNGANVEGVLKVQSTSVDMNSANLNFLIPSALDLFVQVKNTTTGVRVLIWRRDFVTYSVANADIDSNSLSDVSANLPSLGGIGIYAGLSLVNSTVNTAVIGGVLVETD